MFKKAGHPQKLAKVGLIERLFDRFDQHLAAKGYMARGGQMVDATIVPVPTQRNSRDENEAVKAGRIPQEWDNKPAKLRQKDRDARWTKRHGRSFFGYKNHVNADAKHKLIRRYEVTDAAVHDSQKLDELLTKGNTSADVFGDSAYRSREVEERLRAGVEHVFAAQQTALGGRIVRTIGIVRARAKIGLQNLAYNIRRLVTLERIAAA